VPGKTEEIIIERPDGRRRTILPIPSLFLMLPENKGRHQLLMDITRQGELKHSLEKELTSKTYQLKEN